MIQSQNMLKTPVFARFEMFRKVNLRTLKFFGKFFWINTRSSGRNKEPDIFDTVIELDITGKWVFRPLAILGYFNLYEELINHQTD